MRPPERSWPQHLVQQPRRRGQGQIHPQQTLIQHEQGPPGLFPILCPLRLADMFQVLLRLLAGQLLRMAFAVEQDVAACPLDML
jgi:hypothetical protein